MIIGKTGLTNFYIFLPSRNTVLYSLGFLDFSTLYYAPSHWLYTYQCQARGGRGGRATHGNLTVTHIPRVGILT